MIIVNFAILNHISEDFLHDILTFTLKNAYTEEWKRNIKDKFRYLNYEVIVLILIDMNELYILITK